MTDKNDSDGLTALLAEVVEWGEETFPTVTLRAKIEHLRREVEELQQRPTAAEEIADILMITAHIASDVGVDLEKAIADKFEVVKAREWGEPDIDGVIEHKKKTMERWIEEGGIRKDEPRYLFEDLLHVYDNFVSPKLSKGRMLSLVNRGWIHKEYDSTLETDIWAVTGLGWAALENAGLVPKAHGGE